MEKFKKLISACIEKGITDLHLTGGHPLVLRKNDSISFQKNHIWSPQEIDALANALLNRYQKEILRKRWSVDFARTISNTRLRINIFATNRGLSLAIRFLPGQIPTIKSLNLHPALVNMTNIGSGLVLICGATGSGKSTTIAAMLNEINQQRAAHIITLEDPIEYRFHSVNSFIEQRELGTHFPSFAQGLIDVLREMPDVILVGELREPETIRLTLNAAESGHLVLATLHASTPEEAIYRICNAFDIGSQEFVRFQLSSSLAAVLVQKIIYQPNQGFRVPLLSILQVTTAAKSAIRDNKLSQIDNIIEVGRREGMYSFERYQREFLDTKKDFISPLTSFKPCEEDFQEENYLSRLIADQNQQFAVPKLQDSGGVSLDVNAIKKDDNEENNSYKIGEEDKVEDLIKKITSRGQQ